MAAIILAIAGFAPFSLIPVWLWVIPLVLAAFVAVAAWLLSLGIWMVLFLLAIFS